MSIDPEHVQQLLDRLRRLLDETGQAAEIEPVHRLRTHTRRVEALLLAPPAKPFKGKQKLLQRLQRLRRRAGKVRDLDVQLAALATVHERPAATSRQALQRRLERARKRQATRLRARLAPLRLPKLQRGLQAAEKHLTVAGRHSGDGAQQRAAAEAHRRFARMNRPLDRLSDPELHSWRIECKRLRYRLEALGAGDARVGRMIAALKRIQDAVGTWHDWLTLTHNAEKLLPPRQASGLLPILHRTTARRRRQALRVIAAVRAQWGRLL